MGRDMERRHRQVKSDNDALFDMVQTISRLLLNKRDILNLNTDDDTKSLISMAESRREGEETLSMVHGRATAPPLATPVEGGDRGDAPALRLSNRNPRAQTQDQNGPVTQQMLSSFVDRMRAQERKIPDGPVTPVTTKCNSLIQSTEGHGCMRSILS